MCRHLLPSLHRPGIAVLAIASLAALACDPTSAVDLAITGVTLVDPASGEVAEGRTVIVSDGVVRSVLAADEELPAGVRELVDGSGRYLVPGLWDMHTHLDSHTDTDLAMLVVHGVLNVRDMGGDPFVLADLKARIAAGEIVGPGIRGAGAILEDRQWLRRARRVFPELEHRLPVDNPEEARASVALLARWGADLVKVRNLTDRRTLAGIVGVAREHGLTVGGHEPMIVDIDEAAAIGMTTFEHLPFVSLTMPGREADEARLEEATVRLLESGAYVTPTLIASRKLGWSREERAAAIERPDERYAYLPESVRVAWVESLEGDAGPLPWGAMYEASLGMALTMHEAGVPLLAGTDMGVPLTFPGSSLHDELGYLVDDLGLTPLEALRTATSAPAALFGAAEGSIAPRLTANLVLLDADPLADIGNTRSIHAVVLRGELLTRAELDETLAWVREHKDDPPGPAPFERLAASCRDDATPGCLERLADYHFSKNDFAAARAGYAEALEAGAGDPSREGLFASVLNLVWDESVDCAEVEAPAAGLLAEHVDDPGRTVGLLDRLLPALGDGCPELRTGYLRRLAAVDPAALDAATRPIHAEHYAAYLAHVEGDEEAAFRTRREQMAEGWEDDSAALRELATWCADQGVALDRARELAQRAARVAVAPIDRLYALMLEARIAAAQGDPAAAVALMEAVDRAVPDNATVLELLATYRAQADAAGAGD